MSLIGLTQAVERAEAYISRSLWEGGFVPCYAEAGRPDTNPFATSFLLNAARFSRGEALKLLAERAAETLWEMRDSLGLWRYYPFLPPDIDDLGAVGYELLRMGYPVRVPWEALAKVRSPSGLYHTWLFKKNKGPPDACANANLLRLEWSLGRRDSLLLEALEARVDSPVCPYYSNPRLSLAYFLSRAYRDGVPLSPEAREKLARAALEEPKRCALDWALALNALLNLGYQGPELAEYARELISLQNPDGSWPSCPFWLNELGEPFYSPHLTTILALEALLRL